jgi:hypothetical protein
MSSIAEAALAIVQCFQLALLPSPERDRLARRTGLDAPLCSFLFGLVQGGVGVTLYLMAGLAFMRASSMGVSMFMLENWWPGLTNTHMAGGAVVSWLVWLIHPVSWPFAYLALVGLLRVCAFAITREAVGEPLVLVVLRIVQSVVRRQGERSELKSLGPPRSDRLRPRGRGWEVITCRPKPGWDEVATVEIDADHFVITGVERRLDGPWLSIVYRLEPMDELAIVRRLVRFPRPSDRTDAF